MMTASDQPVRGGGEERSVSRALCFAPLQRTAPSCQGFVILHALENLELVEGNLLWLSAKVAIGVTKPSNAANGPEPYLDATAVPVLAIFRLHRSAGGESAS
jgi:hypothetical protein